MVVQKDEVKKAKKKAKKVKTKNNVFAEEFQYPSLSTKGFCHEQPECFIAEILTYRHARKKGEVLPSFFWRKNVECTLSYKKEFTDNIECIRKLINMGIQAHFMVVAFLYYIKDVEYCQYDKIIFIVKKCWTNWKKNIFKSIDYDHVKILETKNVMIDISDAVKKMEEDGFKFEPTNKKRKINY